MRGRRDEAEVENFQAKEAKTSRLHTYNQRLPDVTSRSRGFVRPIHNWGVKADGRGLKHPPVVGPHSCWTARSTQLFLVQG